MFFLDGLVDNAESWRQCVDICKEWLFFLEHKEAVAEKPNALNCARVSSFHFVEKRICKVFVIQVFREVVFLSETNNFK